uniref:Uncharacterized protein n=2 Tax=Phlebotomus papatasi TaxID=29031 RepID=A0A1B0D5R6_PHLPP
PLPVILYVDGHKSHLTLPLSEFCSSHGIEIIVLYPNSTHIIQPLDAGYFSPLKAAWAKERGRWQLAHPRERFSRQNFTPTLEKAIRSLRNREILRNGFRHCGLFPFNH